MVDPAEKDYAGPSTAYTAPQDEVRSKEGPKVYSLVKHLVDDVAILIRKELALGVSEVSESINDTKKGIGGLVSGAAVLNAGFLFLLAAATLGLAQVMAGWLAALIVGGITAIIGLTMVNSGKKKMEASNFKPRRTMEEMQKDRATVKGAKYDHH